MKIVFIKSVLLKIILFSIYLSILITILIIEKEYS